MFARLSLAYEDNVTHLRLYTAYFEEILPTHLSYWNPEKSPLLRALEGGYCQMTGLLEEVYGEEGYLSVEGRGMVWKMKRMLE